MPSDLTTPVSIHTGALTSTSVISIDEIVIRPPKGDIEGKISVVISQGSGDSAFRVPGVFTVANNLNDPTLKEAIAGRYWDIPVGPWFDQAASAAPDPSATSMFEAIKLGVYRALQSRYPDLQGNIV